MRIKNVTIHNLEGAIKASKYPMAIDINKCTSEITNTTLKLSHSPKGSAHDNFLNGIVVVFDLTFTNKAWVEFERYHFAEIVSCQSTMHRIARFEIRKCVNKYVTENTIQEVERLVAKYNETQDKEDYLRLLYNIPSGFELTAQIVTNYGQLKTMYNQRNSHRLPEWREYCEWIETLPKFKRLCLSKGEPNE